MLCGCETLGSSTLAMGGVTRRLDSIYGVEKKIRFEDAVFGFLALFHLVAMKGMKPEAALEEVYRLTTVRIRRIKIFTSKHWGTYPYPT